jgi:alpha-L-fucosidase
MKLKFFLGLALLLATLGVSPAQNQSADPYASETRAERDARMAWWREARFGMFIHWGVYSVPAGIYHGKPIPGIGEWIMSEAKIPQAEYRQFAKQFNPTNFNAEAWVRVAKAAGMKYIVITAKHHDGFAMFDSKVNDWNIVAGTPYAHDPIKDLAQACQKAGLKFGLYYSQAQDWNNGGAAAAGKWDPAQQHDMDDFVDHVDVPQIKEILSNYGPISVLWFDTPVDMNRARAEKILPLLKLQPGIIYNNRLGGGFNGDTETPEQSIPATGFANGRDWETCMTINDTWGFKKLDDHFKSTSTLLRNLIDIASKGGNYLLNVGPDSTGVIPAPEVARLAEVGKWMDVNGPAIYGTTASPFKRLPWGRCTKKVQGATTTLYLHVFNWPSDGKLLIPGLRNQVSSATLLASGQTLTATTVPEGVTINLPASAPDAISSTVVITITAPLDIAAVPSILQNAAGIIKLSAADADLHGDNIQYESDKDCLGFWTNPNDSGSWTFKLDHPGHFTVNVETASLAPQTLELSVGSQSLKQTGEPTGDYTSFKQSTVPGTLDLSAPGTVTLTAKAVAQDWQPVNLRAITLTPAP